MALHKINDQWIRFEDTGGNLPPVVLAHGLLMDHEMFAPQVEALRSGCRIITWDARCHGETETTDGPFSYWDLAEDLRGLLDHLGIEVWARLLELGLRVADQAHAMRSLPERLLMPSGAASPCRQTTDLALQR